MDDLERRRLEPVQPAAALGPALDDLRAHVQVLRDQRVREPRWRRRDRRRAARPRGGGRAARGGCPPRWRGTSRLRHPGPRLAVYQANAKMSTAIRIAPGWMRRPRSWTMRAKRRSATSERSQRGEGHGLRPGRESAGRRRRPPRAEGLGRPAVSCKAASPRGTDQPRERAAGARRRCHRHRGARRRRRDGSRPGGHGDHRDAGGRTTADDAPAAARRRPAAVRGRRRTPWTCWRRSATASRDRDPGRREDALGGVRRDAAPGRRARRASWPGACAAMRPRR